jgi:hypothetical protein
MATSTGQIAISSGQIAIASGQIASPTGQIATSTGQAPSVNTVKAKSTVAAAPPTPSSAAVGTEANGTAATTHALATTRLPATTLGTYRAVVSAVSSSERACERVRACGSMSVRVRVCVYERASKSM